MVIQQKTTKLATWWVFGNSAGNDKVNTVSLSVWWDIHDDPTIWLSKNSNATWYAWLQYEQEMSHKNDNIWQYDDPIFILVIIIGSRRRRRTQDFIGSKDQIIRTGCICYRKRPGGKLVKHTPDHAQMMLASMKWWDSSNFESRLMKHTTAEGCHAGYSPGNQRGQLHSAPMKKCVNKKNSRILG